ncbi:MAG: hypothetical protein K0S37_4102, partial [Microbacterium sp.]|nr:hypothetical protein [Microbacterium sp.]
MEDAEFIVVPAWLRMDINYARARVYAVRNRETVLRLMAALDQWRTMTVHQVEALTDVAGIADGYKSLVSALWNVGLIEVCAMGATFGARSIDRGQLLIRPSANQSAFKDLTDALGTLEWLSVTAGLGFDSDRQYARHNVLATELGLRLAEHGQVGMVLGEKLSTMGLLAYAGVGAEVPAHVRNASDLVLIRPDGLRIAVEMTATTGAGLRDKVVRLVRILDDRSLAKTGLTVLFVVAPRHDATASSASMARTVKREVQRAVHDWRGSHHAPSHTRVGVVRWEDWCPAPGVIVSDFGRLPVDRPTGPGYRGDLDDPTVWQREYMLDPTALPFHPDGPGRMRRVLQGARMLRGVPH